MDVAITSKILSSSLAPEMKCQKNPSLESKNPNDKLGECVCLSSFFFILPLHNTLYWRVGKTGFYVPTGCVCTCVCVNNPISAQKPRACAHMLTNSLSQVLEPLEISRNHHPISQAGLLTNYNIMTSADSPSQTLSPASLPPPLPYSPIAKTSIIATSSPTTSPLPIPLSYDHPCHHHHHQHHLPLSPITSTTLQSLNQQSLLGHLLCARHCCRY